MLIFTLKATILKQYFCTVSKCVFLFSNLSFNSWLSSGFAYHNTVKTTTILGTQNLWPLLTGGRCSEVTLCYKTLKWDSKMVVVIDKWSLLGGGR